MRKDLPNMRMRCLFSLLALSLSVSLSARASDQTQPSTIDVTTLIPTIATTQDSPPTTQPARITTPKDPHVFLTEEELAQAFREGQYTLVIREAGRVEQAKEAITANYNMFDVAIFRAESFLRLQDFATAARAFQHAYERATGDEGRALAMADYLMIQSRVNKLYIPKTPENANTKPGERPAPVRPLDITDFSQRPLIYRALFRDALAANIPTLHRVQSGNSIQAIIASGKIVDILANLEFAATGSSENSIKMRTILFDRGVAMLRAYVDTLANRIAQGVPSTTTLGASHDVKSMNAELQYLSVTCSATQSIQNAKDLAAAYHSDSDALDQVIADVNKLNLEVKMIYDNKRLNPMPPIAPTNVLTTTHKP